MKVESTIPALELLESCLIQDRHPLRKRIRTLHRKQREGKTLDSDLAHLWPRLEQSRKAVEQRRQLRPEPRFPADLPISERQVEIADLIAQNQVIILCGETGSGKSTQLPKICLDLGRGIFGRIGHTQPRRIAARALAARISEELGRELGDSVGYKVRFHDRVGPNSHIKLMTDGMLLAEIQQDRYLNEYDTLIIDEAHERSLNIDFLLGYLKELLPKRRDLKLIITSATIDPERFSKHFWDAPIINVSGRTFPVEVRYRPPQEESGGERDDAVQQAILSAVDELSRIDRGDILVFLSGEREIRETAENLRKHKLPLTEVLPLYARLGPAEQARVFRSGGKRRIILATNVAETSLTVPGIRYVIDAGYARISRYSHRSKVQRLPVERIARASADQRKGRCGRVAAGICIRLYDEEDFAARAEFTEPEIQRTNLASVILQMKLLGFGNIEQFPFVDKPDNRLIRDGYRVLEEIGAMDPDRRITPIGRALSRLPVDPRVGRMLLAATENQCLSELLVIASALSVQDPRERPMDKQQAADEAHREFRHEESDFLGTLNLWRHLEEIQHHLSRRKFQAHCRSRFLSWNRVQEWRDIHHQLRGQLHEMGYRENEKAADYEAIHKSLLSGLLSNIGMRQSGNSREYLGARNSHFFVFPGSALFKKQPKWLVAAELVETSKLYARTVAGIQPEWAEAVAGHLVKQEYSEPHWEKKRGQVAAYTRITLFGLPIIPRRKVNYGPINPVEAREIFIRSALVDQDFHTRAPFWRHNRQVIDSIHLLEEKTRRRDLLVDEQTLYDYYDQRIPAGIYSAVQFEKWLRQETRVKPKLLHMRTDDLMANAAGDVADQYPDTLEMDGLRLPLEYHFNPGDPTDGVKLKIPQAVLNQVPEARTDWLVPGLLRERIIALLKSLPKAMRKSFVPVPDYADACLKVMTPSDKPLIRQLSEQLHKMTGVYIPGDAWQEAAVEKHLRMNFQVLDEAGRPIAEGRDLQALKKQHASQGESRFHSSTETGLEREDVTDWDFAPLPKSVMLQRAGIRLPGFPALVVTEQGLAVRVVDSEQHARDAHRAGVGRLVMLRLAKDIRYIRRNIPQLQKMRLQYAKAPVLSDQDPADAVDLEQELVTLIVDLTFVADQPEIRDAESFNARINLCKPQLVPTANTVIQLAGDILEQYQQVAKKLAACTQMNWMSSLADMRQQLDRLVFKGFFRLTPIQQLRQIPRYLEALQRRLDKLNHAAARDQQLLREMQTLYQMWLERDQRERKSGTVDERLEEIRWSLEELRVSLFAQELKTAYPVSIKRIAKRWKALGL
ncbi:ATP-dependent RNA helicase HrpA [Sedimenticola sp.]|uniref:ATP-dependent RNA helicase HrpA n=1 Tax=Sedimenticola sp. TaxID=1940285 RepID=UPI00258E878A|nr:ATP-dependent RNA helicase HrpA [Sedimenticola sp.]MCW8904429.1 ATP-dependent RNA helicase HrpA [Sedimenticola sp.]